MEGGRWEGGLGEKWRPGGGQGEGQDSPHSAWPRLGMSTRSGGLGDIVGLYVAIWHFGESFEYFFGSQYTSSSVGTNQIFLNALHYKTTTCDWRKSYQKHERPKFYIRKP